MDNIQVLKQFISETGQDKRTISVPMAFQAIQLIEEELQASDRIIADRLRVLQAIPPCTLHGDTCVPHALDWIKGVLHPLSINTPIHRKSMLFVDDRTKRIHYALDNFPDYAVTIAPNVPEALRQMCANEWDVISLDHDLTGHDFEDPDTPTCGMEIVRYLVKCGGWPYHAEFEKGFSIMRRKPEFWIHSSNLFAAHLMITTLKNIGLHAYYKPITYQVEHMTYDEKGHPK